MKIYAPVKDANGVYASVRFVNGVGETDNPRLIEWFKAHGYKVPLEDDAVVDTHTVSNEPDVVETDKIAEEEPEMMGYSEKVKPKPVVELPPNIDEMPPYELRDWMVEHGFKVGNVRSKGKLLEMLRG